MHRIFRLTLFLAGLAILLGAETRAQCSFPPAHSANVLTYSFEPILSANKLSLRVMLEFNAGSNRKARLMLPSEWAGQRYVEKSITELRAISPDTDIAGTNSPAEKEIHFEPGTTVKVVYTLVKDWEGPLNGGTRFRADLSPDYFHIIGTTSFVHPKINDFDVADVRFDWQRLPQSWSLATSFGTDDRCQSFHGPWRQALNALFVGGDYRIYRTTIDDNTLNFAIRGKWNFTDHDWVKQVSKIIEFERRFWRDNNFPYFLVSLTPLDHEHGNNGGTALTSAFMEHLSHQDELSRQVLEELAHETFHAWNPYKIGLPRGSYYHVSWFFEGFTAYYQDVMLLRAGLITFPEYIVSVNEKLQHYQMQEGMNVSLEEFVRRHSADYRTLDQLDERRGAVIGLWLDATIRKNTRNKSSLDNLMFDLVDQETWQTSRHGKPVPLTNRRIFAAVSKYVSGESMHSLREFVQQGGPIPAPANALGPCSESRTEMLSLFDAGFDLRSLDSKIVKGVEPESEAYKAGMRDGQELAAASVYRGDTNKEVRVTVKDTDGSHVITYFPRGRKIPVQQFILDSEKYAANPQSCEQVLR